MQQSFRIRLKISLKVSKLDKKINKSRNEVVFTFIFAMAMNREIKSKFPKWINDSVNNYQLMLSDDIDSLVGCCILQQLKGYKINYFYDFETIYKADQDNKNKIIAVDVALNNGRCWDNHVTRFDNHDSVNKQSANINSIYNITRDNYYLKYAMSTTLLIWSYYDLPLPKSEEGKMLLLAIDSAFEGFYSDKFKDIHHHHLNNILGLHELQDVLERHSRQDFIQLQKETKLKDKIYIDDNLQLTTSIDIDTVSQMLDMNITIPTITMSSSKHLQTFTDTYKASHVDKDFLVSDDEMLFSFAFTSKNKMKYSTIER